MKLRELINPPREIEKSYQVTGSIGKTAFTWAHVTSIIGRLKLRDDT